MVPWENAAGNEQVRNAQFLAERGAALALIRPRADGQHLLDGIRSLVRDEHVREEMARAARALGQPDAAERLAREVLRAATEPMIRARG
jgi:UDP-N-acetylglucosamine--N-acetylmuramyl-(pentapeptide) pyrophosphoryl-undecaprenol N-acetylglucosamine transferase